MTTAIHELMPSAASFRFDNSYARELEGFYVARRPDVVRELTALENKDSDFVNAWFFLAEAEHQLGDAQKAARDAAHFLTLHTTDDALASRARELAGP